MRKFTSRDLLVLTPIRTQARNARQIAVVLGAGVSVSAGIPDFRSQEGIFNQTIQQSLHYLYSLLTTDDTILEAFPNLASVTHGLPRPTLEASAKTLLQVDILRNDTGQAAFRRFAFLFHRRVQSDDVVPSKMHMWLEHITGERKLVRCYTQNIDGLEGRAGLETSSIAMQSQAATIDKVVQLHGDVNHLRCESCNSIFPWDTITPEFFSVGFTAPCPHCTRRSQERMADGRRAVSIGSLRPNIVLYDEEDPFDVAKAQVINKDTASRLDLLIIAGTSLAVPGIQATIKQLAQRVHAVQGLVILVNQTSPAASTKMHHHIDIHLCMACDEWVEFVRQHQRPSPVSSLRPSCRGAPPRQDLPLPGQHTRELGRGNPSTWHVEQTDRDRGAGQSSEKGRERGVLPRGEGRNGRTERREARRGDSGNDECDRERDRQYCQPSVNANDDLVMNRGAWQGSIEGQSRQIQEDKAADLRWLQAFYG